MTTVVIPVYNDVTQLDFTAPHQFLTMIPDIKVVIASVGAKAVTSTGLVFDHLTDLEAIETCDVLCTPGGLGCIEAIEDPRYMSAVRKLARSATYLTSVCSGSLILGAAGMLQGRRATSHWAYIDLLPAFGAIPEKGRVVRDGNVITGGGVTAGMDFALTLIAELRGEGAAQCAQLALEYAPNPPFNAGAKETAPVAIRDMVVAQFGQLMGDTHKRVAAFVKSRH
jgi:cyclohexyl-isocyanide hydratase